MRGRGSPLTIPGFRRHTKAMSIAASRIITWKDEYRIGIYRIDVQHRELFRLSNLIMELEGPSQAVLRSLILAFRDYMICHFAEEEQLMASAAFPGLAEHQVLHQTILRQMDGIGDHAGSLEGLQSKLRNVTHTWVVKHVKECDSQFGSFIETTGG